MLNASRSSRGPHRFTWSLRHAMLMQDYMSLVAENESPLPVTVTERDVIAAGAEEGSMPALEICATIQCKQEEFCRALDWAGTGSDSERAVSSPDCSRAIVVVIHRIPRFAACSARELSEQWRNLIPITRVTTLPFQEGDLDYLVKALKMEES